MNLRKIRPWAFYFLAWTLVGLIYFAQNVTRRFYWDDPNPGRTCATGRQHLSMRRC
jgi:hypothetical protein